MDSLSNALTCTGCGACASVCPKGAIQLLPDVEGFCYPVVNKCQCNGCGLCVRTCPLTAPRHRDASPTCYAARSRDADLVAKSSSGGIFSELATKTIQQGGVVFGASYCGDSLTVRHIGVDRLSELSRLRGSKYVQSYVDGTYEEVKSLLDAQRPVLFSGTPCQIAGLLAYLRNPSNMLLTVEVICHGVPPPKLFNLLKEDMARAHGKLIGISFRDKTDGWTSRAITGWYAGGAKIREHGALNAYFKAFIAHLSLRKCCERCMFNDGKSGADITLGDFWGIDRVLPEFNDDLGVSAVIIHTLKGKTAFESIGSICKEVRLSDITPYNPSYCAERYPDKERDKFMRHVYKNGIVQTANKSPRLRKPSVLARIFNNIIVLGKRLRTVN